MLHSDTYVYYVPEIGMGGEIGALVEPNRVDDQSVGGMKQVDDALE